MCVRVPERSKKDGRKGGIEEQREGREGGREGGLKLKNLGSTDTETMPKKMRIKNKNLGSTDTV